MNPYQPPSIAADVAPELPADPIAFTSVFGLIRRAFSIYFDNLAIIAPVTLALFAPVELAKNYYVHAARVGDNLLVTSRIEMLIESVLGSLVTAALLHALVQRLETGRASTVREALAAGVKRWGNVFGARFRSGFLVLVGILLLIVPGVVWLVRYALTDEVATLETDRSAARVLNRSAELVRGHGLRIFGVGVLAMLVVVPLQFLGGVVSGFVDSWVVTAVVDSINDVVYRFFMVVTLLVYLGLGGRKGAGAPV